RDSLEHRQRRPHVPGRRRYTPSHRAAWLLAGCPRGQARGARLLGAHRPARVAELGRVREGDADARRALLLFDQSDTPRLGGTPRRSWRDRAGVRARSRRAAGRASRALSRSTGGDADRVAARPVAQSVDQRGNRGVRSTPAAPDRGLVKMRVAGLLVAMSFAVTAVAAAAFALAANAAEASIGLTQIAAQDRLGVVTVYYPSTSEAQTIKRGPFTFQMAADGAPSRGNGRLIVISHGSGGSPWVHANLAQTLVADGFIVAMPAHRGDNYSDPGTPGPES